ncbi:MAG TPA: VOC family protein [Acidimicrobiales bacterium]|nr:VOC family protein [Acidimicrobiales bacterium]
MSAGIGAELDHLAVAAETWDELWPRYRGDLGGDWVAGGPSLGFASAQLRYANGMKIEVLAPQNWERNDFLRRFLDRRGPGPHHMTFKVPAIEKALEASEAAGYRPVGVDLSDPGWKEAFLHPKDAPGVVIQLAQSAGEWDSPSPVNLPAARVEASEFLYVGHAVTRFDDGVRLFAGLLNGEERTRGHDDLLDADWIEYFWSAGGVVRVFAMPAWLGGDVGRLHHAAFATREPEAMRDAKPTGDGRYEVAPEANLGTRLMVSASVAL